MFILLLLERHLGILGQLSRDKVPGHACILVSVRAAHEIITVTVDFDWSPLLLR